MNGFLLISVLATALGPASSSAQGLSSSIGVSGFVPSSCRVTSAWQVGCNGPVQQLVSTRRTPDQPTVITVRPAV